MTQAVLNAEAGEVETARSSCSEWNAAPQVCSNCFTAAWGWKVRCANSLARGLWLRTGGEQPKMGLLSQDGLARICAISALRVAWSRRGSLS